MWLIKPQFLPGYFQIKHRIDGSKCNRHYPSHSKEGLDRIRTHIGQIKNPNLNLEPQTARTRSEKGRPENIFGPWPSEATTIIVTYLETAPTEAPTAARSA